MKDCRGQLRSVEWDGMDKEDTCRRHAFLRGFMDLKVHRWSNAMWITDNIDV